MSPPPPGLPFPAGWRLRLDPAARRTDGGGTLVGGSPLRILRLTAAGARLLDRLAAGEPVPGSDGARRLARRLVDAGAAHPDPPEGAAPFGPVDVAAVVPVRDEDPAPAVRSAAAAGVGAVVVVDDGSRRPVPQAALRHDRPRGPGAARNTGWRAPGAAGARAVAFLDADVEAPDGWLDRLLAHLGDPAVGAVAPRVRSAGGAAPRLLAAYEAARSPLDLGPGPAPVRPGTRAPYVPTACLLVRREALEDVGGFDGSLAVGEDVDLVWRLHEAGWRVRYEPAVEVRHPARPGWGAWLGQRFRYGTSAAPLAARHGGAVSPLGVSGWSALAWGAAAAGHPVAGGGVAAATTAALVPKLRGLDRPGREALRIAGLGHLHAGRAVADALVRAWWPLTALAAWRVRRLRPAALAAAVVPALVEHRTRRPAVGPLAWVALRLADDLAYGAGLWWGCLRARSARALRPRFTGPLPPPAAAPDAAPAPAPGPGRA